MRFGRMSADEAASALKDLGAQAALGFPPIQQGGGANQGTNKVYVGYDGSNGYPRLQVDLSDMGQILCAAQALLALGPTGKIKLFGLLIQWDTVTSSASGFAVSFPVAFANACIGVLPVSTYPAGSNTAYTVNYDTPTKSGCNIQTRCITGGSVANQASLPIVYFALGY